MKVIIQPSTVKGKLAAPPSKSAMQRACAAALLTGGITTLQNPGISNDDEAALNIIEQFGAIVTKQEAELTIDSRNHFLACNNEGATDDLQIDCGESGLSIRMFTPIAALGKRPVRIVGSGSLRKRPMNFFDTVLPELGIQITSQNGHIPLQIQGPLQPANIVIDGSLSSQFLTGILMAYAAANASDVTIEVTDLKSKPYIDLTLTVMRSFGMPVPLNEDYQRFYFPRRIQSDVKTSTAYKVEGDWSGGAFLLVAGAVHGGICIEGLDANSTQADKKILEALQDCGASILINDIEIKIQKKSLTPFHFDATDCPDLFPPLVALAAYCKGQTIIKGISRLQHKESNRAITLQTQFEKLGVHILLKNDDMIIESNGIVNGSTVHSCHDHRIAMACAVAALGATDSVTIEDAEAINKSYPEFYAHLQHLGVDVSIYNN